MTKPKCYKRIDYFEFQNVIYDVFPKAPIERLQTQNLIKRVETSFIKNIHRMKGPNEAVSIRLKSGQIFFIKRSPTLLPHFLEKFSCFLLADLSAMAGALRYLGPCNDASIKNRYYQRLVEHPVFDPCRSSLEWDKEIMWEAMYS